MERLVASSGAGKNLKSLAPSSARARPVKELFLRFYRDAIEIFQRRKKRSQIMSQDYDRILEYHQRTKHRPNAYARGPGRLDWANQPDPFRKYQGAPEIALEKKGFEDEVERPSPLNLRAVSQFFFESLAISAWKSYGGTRWSLRVNPSSGNLHPTEAYLIAGEIEDLDSSPGVFHYSSKEHALELRSQLSRDGWEALGLPEDTFLLALSSIYWRESWKYGERAFRYCMLDAGHALAALGIAASCLGWRAELVEAAGTKDLKRLLGIADQHPGEEEHPDCLLAVCAGKEADLIRLTVDALSNLQPEQLLGRPNVLSTDHVSWQAIDIASEAVVKPATPGIFQDKDSGVTASARNFCSILRARRSAQAMDARTKMPLPKFWDICRAVMPARVPFNILPWRPFVHTVLFVHRVDELKRGLYLLVRDEGRMDQLQQAMLSRDFSWQKPAGCPEDLGLYLLAQGDSRIAAKQSSCNQDIASDGCFAAAMIAEFDEPLKAYGAWFYPRLHWECGMIGHALYLAAELSGFRGCGIGCFLDDVVHRMLGLEGWGFQDLYHFTVGMPIEDQRITSLPAYG